MNDDIKIILENVLTLIEYKDIKKAFIDEFIKISMQQTLMQYMEFLPVVRRKEVEQILQEKSPENLANKIVHYLLTEEYKKLLQENNSKLLLSYLGEIVPTLSKEQKKSLNTYFASLSIE